MSLNINQIISKLNSNISATKAIKISNKAYVTPMKNVAEKILKPEFAPLIAGTNAVFLFNPQNKNELKQDINTQDNEILNEKEEAEKIYETTCYEVIKDLKSREKKQSINDYLEICSYIDEKGNPVFSKEIRCLLEELKTLFPFVANKDLHPLLTKIYEKDENDNIIIKSDIYEEILFLSDIKKNFSYIEEIIEASIINGKISKDAINFASNSYFESHSGFFLAECIKTCTDKNGFNNEMANLYKFIFKEKINFIHQEEIMRIMLEYKDGEKIIKPLSILEDIIKETKKEPYKRKIQSLYGLKNILDSGCKVEDFLKYYDLAKIKYGNRYIPANEIPAIVSVAVFQKPKTNSEETKVFNGEMIDVLKKYEDIFRNENDGELGKNRKRIAISKLINSCKLFDAHKGEYFDENIMQKAFLLLEKGVPLYNETNDIISSPLAELINACKIKSSFQDSEKTIFDEKTFNKVIELFTKAEQGAKNANIKNLLKALNFCKEYDSKLKKEFFNLEAFELYLNFITTNNNIKLNFNDILKKNQKIDMEVLNFCSSYPDIDLQIFIDTYKDETGNMVREFNFGAVSALKALENIEYRKNGKTSKQNLDKNLWAICYDKTSSSEKLFNPKKFEIILNLLKKDFNAEDLITTFSDLNLARITAINSLIEEGIEIYSAKYIVTFCCDDKGVFNENDLSHCLDLYNFGMRGLDIKTGIASCYDIVKKSLGIIPEKKVFNEQAYTRLKELFSQDLPINLIQYCKDNQIFKDRLYFLMMNLKKKNYPINEIGPLMNICKNKQIHSLTGDKIEYFEPKIYDKIFELEKLGIDKFEIAKVLESCKYDEIFSTLAYDKISELYYKEYDSSGIAKILSNSYYNKNFSIARYNEILILTKNHKRLRNTENPSDELVVKKLLDNEKSINDVKEIFGEDILNYATSAKIDNYISLVKNCKKILQNNSNHFISKLINRINSLVSPELKVKRLQILGILSDKTDELVLSNLLEKIKSPKLSEKQKEIINKIFSDESKTPTEQIDNFIKTFNVPEKHKQYIIDYLKKAQLHKHINKPETLEVQLKQMDDLAEQTLINPNIPLEKKLKYITEYNLKKENMLSNPEQYTSPQIHTRTLNELQKIIEAYIIIPNLDIDFNNASSEIMYKALGIKTTKELLDNIQYDAKYFDRFFTSHHDFRINFKRLIELVKLNPGKNLSSIRLALPEKDSDIYKIYKDFNLVKQVEANLETKKQFEDAGLNFEKWNQYDEELKGEIFNVENNAETMIKNLKDSIFNELTGSTFLKISKEETEKFFKIIFENKFSITNNDSFLSISELSKLLEKIDKYLQKSEYFKSALGKGSLILTDAEKNGATAFIDHIKDFKQKLEEIKNAKNINNIHLRLANFDNIGRNIFFGNHVGCCNSVDSPHAGYSAPQHLLNSYVRGIEIVDEYGISYGNSLCYFANIDGKISFVIDSFEANGKLASNPIITENIIKFAQQICSEIGCNPENIYFGINNTNINLSDLTLIKAQNFKILGSVSELTYCDTLGGRVLEEINQIQQNTSLYSL